jgi:hypothetical protein
MKDLIKRPSGKPLIHARNYHPGVEVKIEVVNGDIYALKTDSESIQVTVVGLSNESVQVRIDDFESSVDAESDGYRKGETVSVSRDHLWPQEDVVKVE